MSAALYPLFLNLQGRTCVVVGGDATAEAKTRDLLAAGARVSLISPTVTRQIAEWSRAGTLRWKPRAYQEGDLADAFLAVSCAGAAFNARVFAECEERNMFCNAVDDVEHCNCYASAVVRRGPLQIAISTAGKSPALAQRLRKELEQQFSPEYASWVEKLGELRGRLFDDECIDPETRTAILHEQASGSAFEAYKAQREKGAHPAKSEDCAGSKDSSSRGM